MILSILPHVLQLGDDSSQTEALEAFPIGHVFDQVKVIGNDKHYVYVSFGSSSLFGQIHQSKFDDNKSLLDYSIDLLINLESLDLTKLIIC